MSRLLSPTPLKHGPWQRTVFYDLISPCQKSSISAIELSFMLTMTVIITFWMI